MPIYEYVCKDCKKRFEALVFGSQKASCPLCNGTNLDQQISVFSVGAGTRSEQAACPSAASCASAGRACNLS